MLTLGAAASRSSVARTDHVGAVTRKVDSTTAMLAITRRSAQHEDSG